MMHVYEPRLLILPYSIIFYHDHDKLSSDLKLKCSQSVIVNTGSEIKTVSFGPKCEPT